MITKPGIYTDVSAIQYHADPVEVISLSSTIAKELINRSPRHAWVAHPRLGGRREEADDGEVALDPKSSKEKELGTLGHRLVIGKGGEIVVIDADAYRTTLAKAQRDSAKAAGKIPVLAHKLPEAQEMADACREQLDAMGYDHIFRDGMKECVLVWEEGGTWFRAMVDNLHIDEYSKTAEIHDLKTVGRSSHPKACAAQIAALSYDLSLEFYSRGLAKLRPDLAGRIETSWVFLETKRPFAATPVEINGEWKMAAEMKCDRAIALWRKCMAEGNWPYYVTERVRLDPKPWDLAEALTGDLQ